MKYVANPVEVDAFKIVEVSSRDHVTQSLELKLDNGDVVTADAGMTARFIPQVGDYWVIQSDGYTYLNPKDVFERKYSPRAELRELIHAFVTSRDALVQHISKDFDKTLTNVLLEDLGAR